MKNFIKTWAYRFDATLGPCLIVYAVMALLNAQCIYQTKLSDHPGMGAWFAAKHLDFVFLGAFIAIIVIHVMYLRILMNGKLLSIMRSLLISVRSIPLSLILHPINMAAICLIIIRSLILTLISSAAAYLMLK